MEERSEPDTGSRAQNRESDVIEKYRTRIVGLGAFPGMTFVGLAWASSADPGGEPYERYIDALYRSTAAQSGHADVAVRTWLRPPMTPETFSVAPHLATHLRDFMIERAGGELDLDSGLAEIAEALRQPGRVPGTLALGDIVAVRYVRGDVVTVVGYARYVANPPTLVTGLAEVPRVRRA